MSWWQWTLLFAGLVAVVLFVVLRAPKPDVLAEFIDFLKREQPGIEAVTNDGHWLTVRGEAQGESKINLDNLVRRASEQECESYADRLEVYRQWLAVIAAGEQIDSLMSLESCRDRIYPRLVTPEYRDELLKFRPHPTSYLEELELYVAYVIDSDQFVSYLSEKEIADWGIGLPQIHHLALENLRKNTPEEIVRNALERDALVNVKMLDSYDAARLLVIPGYLRQGEEIAAVIPDRDTLCLTRVPENEDWSSLAKLAQIPLSDHLLLTRPVRVTRDGFELK